MTELGLCFAVELRDDAQGQHFAELDAPLVEGIQIPNDALGEHEMLVERDEFAEHLRREPVGEQRVGRPVAIEDPVRTARTSPLARAFARAIADAGGVPSFKEKSGTSDMNILAPAWRCPMVAYGPGDSRYDHTPIERLSLLDYGRAVSILRGVISRATDPTL